MTTELAGILSRLDKLVSFDTRNPPRAMLAGDAVFAYLSSQLQGFGITLDDFGDGHLALLAVRGTPKTLFNFHLDTVPATDGWRRDPFRLDVTADKATGLGACDIKGALACMLAAVEHHPGDVAILVTTDEEAGVGQSVNNFLATPHGFQNAIIAEPTACKAVCAHRGITTAKFVFKGNAGHASAARALTDNAIHRALRWGSQCLALAETWRDEEAMGLRGVPLNMGRIEGGIKPNMIAEQCEVLLGVRTLPGQSGKDLINQFVALASEQELLNWKIKFHAPSLPVQSEGAAKALQVFVGEHGLEQGKAVDFWSEAALFSKAGLNAVVLGSGDIAQAHTANEWVELSQLSKLTGIYEGLLAHGL